VAKRVQQLGLGRKISEKNATPDILYHEAMDIVTRAKQQSTSHDFQNKSQTEHLLQINVVAVMINTEVSTMDCSKVGKLIFNLRKEKNMTQKELDDAMNLSDRTISKLQ